MMPNPFEDLETLVNSLDARITTLESGPALQRIYSPSIIVQPGQVSDKITIWAPEGWAFTGGGVVFSYPFMVPTQFLIEPNHPGDGTGNVYSWKRWSVATQVWNRSDDGTWGDYNDLEGNFTLWGIAVQTSSAIDTPNIQDGDYDFAG